MRATNVLGLGVAFVAAVAACSGTSESVFGARGAAAAAGAGGSGGAGGGGGAGGRAAATGATSGTAAVSGTTSVGTGPAWCPTPGPVGGVMNCGSSDSAGAGSASTCTVDICDAMGDKWESNCAGQKCSCVFNGVHVCDCSLSPGSLACDPGVLACCPGPFH